MGQRDEVPVPEGGTQWGSHISSFLAALVKDETPIFAAKGVEAYVKVSPRQWLEQNFLYVSFVQVLIIIVIL